MEFPHESMGTFGSHWTYCVRIYPSGELNPGFHRNGIAAKLAGSSYGRVGGRDAPRISIRWVGGSYFHPSPIRNAIIGTILIYALALINENLSSYEN